MADTVSKMAEYILCYYGFLFNCFPATAQVTFLPQKTDTLFPSCGKLKSTAEPLWKVALRSILWEYIPRSCPPSLWIKGQWLGQPALEMTCIYVKIMVKAGHRAWSKSVKAASYGTAMATRIKLSSVQQNTGKGTIKMSQIMKPWESSNGGLPVP